MTRLLNQALFAAAVGDATNAQRFVLLAKLEATHVFPPGSVNIDNPLTLWTSPHHETAH